MKLKYILISIFTFLFMIQNVNATYCDKTDRIEKKNIANNMTISASLVKDENNNDTGQYNISLKGLKENLYVIDVKTGNRYDCYEEEECTITFYNLDSGSYMFKVYYEICADELLRTINYKLPKYNYYANDPLCEGISGEDLEVCDKFYQGELDKEILKYRVEQYKRILEQSEQIQEDNKSTSNTISFIKEYYVYIIITITILVIVTISIIMINKKRGVLE